MQSGTVNDPSTQRRQCQLVLDPSIAVNGQGHAAMGFSAAGITRADAAFTGRLATDAVWHHAGPLTHHEHDIRL
jgi:hypothetical protein